MLPQASLERQSNGTGSVLTSEPDLLPDGPQISQKHHPRRAETARVLSLSIRLRTLGDAPNLTDRIQKVGRSCFDSGGFADIWLGEFVDDPEIKVAVKVLRCGGSNAVTTAKLKQRLEREAVVWLQLHHRFIMPFLGTCNNFDHANLELPSLVSPYFPNGNINVYLQQNPALDPSTGLRNMAQVGEALSYLHSRKVVHGDVKGSNIMIDENGDAKLSDFGISRILESSGFTTKTLAGTVRWMARELLSDDDETGEDAIPVTVESDVWSFGMTILEVLTGKPPYKEMRKDTVVFQAVIQGQLPLRPSSGAVTDGIWELLVKCWASDAKDRPSVESITDALRRL